MQQEQKKLLVQHQASNTNSVAFAWNRMTDHPLFIHANYSTIHPWSWIPDCIVEKISWSAGKCFFFFFFFFRIANSLVRIVPGLSLSASKNAGSMLDQIVAPRIPETDHRSNVAQMTLYDFLWFTIFKSINLFHSIIISNFNFYFILFFKPKPTVRPKDKVWGNSGLSLQEPMTRLASRPGVEHSSIWRHHRIIYDRSLI